MKAFVLMALFACLPLVVAAGAQDRPANQQEDAIEECAYDMQLDVVRVISSTGASSTCGIVPARMTHEGSNGQKHAVEYQVQGNGCTGG